MLAKMLLICMSKTELECRLKPIVSLWNEIHKFEIAEQPIQDKPIPMFVRWCAHRAHSILKWIVFIWWCIGFECKLFESNFASSAESDKNGCYTCALNPTGFEKSFVLRVSENIK